MRKTFSASFVPLCFLCVVGLFGCSSNGQSLITNLPVSRQRHNTTQPTEHANGIVQDWSTSHLVYPRIGEINSLIALQHDSRAILSWQEAERRGFSPGKGSSTLPPCTRATSTVTGVSAWELGEWQRKTCTQQNLLSTLMPRRTAQPISSCIP